ncbi:MAG TPA: NAD-glutamate dehydrogenase, partial [Devosia sp.]|nr:NAD-glutamate dehydrogenase [Devosia sp.]
MSKTANSAKLMSAARKHAASLTSKDPSRAAFLTHALDATHPEDFDRFVATSGDTRFETILDHSYASFSKRAPGDHLIQIWRPDETDPAAVQIIDIFLDDMPFIVDSVLAAIRARGGIIRMFIHPVLPVQSAKKPWKILPEASRDCVFHSFLQVHIDPIFDEVALAELYAEIDGVLLEVRRAVAGWRPMLERLKSLIQSFRQSPPPAVSEPVMAEMLHFLAWLADHNFTFLGMREYRIRGTGDKTSLEPVKDGGLGILVDPNVLFLRNGPKYVEMTEQHVTFLKSRDPIMVTKANVQSRVHRRTHMDYVGVKLYDEKGELTGELRMIGLFTSMSLATPHVEVPLIRRKIADVMRRSKLEPSSHAGKALMAALETYPRDELFQIDTAQLFEFASLIAALADRPQVRVLPRIDRYDNFVSILLYLPRDHYDSSLRYRVGLYLAEQYDGRVSAYYPHFPEGELVRVHYIIGRNGGKTPRPDRTELEAHIHDLMQTFGDHILHEAENPAEVASFAHAFPAGYQSANTPADALDDIKVMKKITSDSDIFISLRASSADHGNLVLKFFHPNDPIPLSSRVPLLENFGFSVIDEHSFHIQPDNGQVIYLHEMHLDLPNAVKCDISDLGPRLERAIQAIWSNHAESDGLNRLALTGELEWDDIAIIRAMVRYLHQLGTKWSQRYIWQALNNQGELVAILIRLFHTLHDPDFSGDRNRKAAALAKNVLSALEKISSLDEDRIVRHLLNLIRNSLRTNFFQRDPDGSRRPALSIKFDSKKIDGMPAPRPYREITVYSPRFEGIHLRGGPIARGGLRWSDRPEDFRTEVLGLVKAQMTKNAVIVPVGSKGGFVPKRMPPNPDRETFINEGIACYKTFIGALLDLTDNLDGDKVLPPPNVVRHDGDDPYLVVAADKGTATFSDIANAISQSYDFWLGDAFASGGSAGYDHKKMGITARGAWEAVKRHFRELDRDIQTSPISVVGVGDMSGDVFGNGMLLSREIRLIAAFDHRDIFIDPNPDPKTSYAERKRIFDLPRSSWQDYDTKLLSPGGGIYSRSSKSISLSEQARKALNFDQKTCTPNELMTAILKAETDLLWFGGIGTYVRASTESNADADDKANDAIRITAAEVGARAIGEGANLGITQLARIEFARKGGMIDTDAIDNSAGVNSSDLEVNIKIALGTLVREGTMDLDSRNEFLAEMTDEVAELCLRNNYLQTLCLSLVQRGGMDETTDLFELMRA